MSAYRILVVEDDELIRKLVRVTLELEGYRAIAAGTGARALALAATELPDLILLDLTLPDMNGIELAARLRRIPHLEDVPLIAVSGLVQGAEEVQRRQAPFIDYLLKPVETSSLLDALREHLSDAAGS